MKSKIAIICIAVLTLLLIPALGCLGGTPDSAEGSIPDRVNTLEENFTGLKTTVQKNADSINNLQSNKLDASAYTESTIDSYTKSQTYDRQAVDEKLSELQTKITALQNRVIELEENSGSSSSSSSSSSSYNKLVDEDNNLKLYLERVDPSSDIVRFYGNRDVAFDFVVENTGTTSEYFFVEIRFSPEDDVAVSGVLAGQLAEAGAELSIIDTYPTSLVGDGSDWELRRSGAAWTTITNNPVYISNTDKIWIGKHSEIGFTVIVHLEEGTDTTEWSYRATIEQD